jgi:hypothetical protein
MCLFFDHLRRVVVRGLMAVQLHDEDYLASEGARCHEGCSIKPEEGLATDGPGGGARCAVAHGRRPS